MVTISIEGIHTLRTFRNGTCTPPDDGSWFKNGAPYTQTNSAAGWLSWIGGSNSFSVQGVNSSGQPVTDCRTISIEAILPQMITNFLANPANPTYFSGATFSVSATGGASTNPVTFSVAPLSTTICSHGGPNGSTITMLNTGICTVLADQAAGVGYSAAQQQSLAVTISFPPFTFETPVPIPSARVGQYYSVQLAATGGSGGYTYSIDSGSLPGGLTLNTNSGLISGTPTTVESATATILAKDNTTHQQTANITIVVDPLDLTVSTQTLPGGQVGQAYSASIVVAGGVAPYLFTLTGDLPEGLALNPATGAITGTPTKAQTSTFSVMIEDSTLLPLSAMAKAAVHSVTQSFSVTVAAAPVAAAPTPVPTLGEWGVIALSSLLGMFGLARSRRRQG